MIWLRGKKEIHCEFLEFRPRSPSWGRAGTTPAAPRPTSCRARPTGRRTRPGWATTRCSTAGWPRWRGTSSPGSGEEAAIVPFFWYLKLIWQFCESFPGETYTTGWHSRSRIRVWLTMISVFPQSAWFCLGWWEIEWAMQLGKMSGTFKSKSTQPRFNTCCVTQY